MNNVGLFAAMLGGLISFVSPCVLPLVPPYLCYIGGVSLAELEHTGPAQTATRKVVAASLAFVLGFSTIFVALGATASVIGQTLAVLLEHADSRRRRRRHRHGAALSRPVPHRAPQSRGAAAREADAARLAGAYVLGLAFALGWTPCIGPILAAILGVAGATDTVWQGAALLVVYSLGLWRPIPSRRRFRAVLH